MSADKTESNAQSVANLEEGYVDQSWLDEIDRVVKEAEETSGVQELLKQLNVEYDDLANALAKAKQQLSPAELEQIEEENRKFEEEAEREYERMLAENRMAAKPKRTKGRKNTRMSI